MAKKTASKKTVAEDKTPEVAMPEMSGPLEACVKPQELRNVVMAFSGHEYIKKEWRPVPLGAEKEAMQHPFLLTRPLEGEKGEVHPVEPKTAEEAIASEEKALEEKKAADVAAFEQKLTDENAAAIHDEKVRMGMMTEEPAPPSEEAAESTEEEGTEGTHRRRRGRG